MLPEYLSVNRFSYVNISHVIYATIGCTWLAISSICGAELYSVIHCIARFF